IFCRFIDSKVFSPQESCHLGGLATPYERIQDKVTHITVKLNQSIRNLFWKGSWMKSPVARWYWGYVPDRVCNLLLHQVVYRKFTFPVFSVMKWWFSQNDYLFVHHIWVVIGWVWMLHCNSEPFLTSSSFVPYYFFKELPTTLSF